MENTSQKWTHSYAKYVSINVYDDSNCYENYFVDLKILYAKRCFFCDSDEFEVLPLYVRTDLWIKLSMYTF